MAIATHNTTTSHPQAYTNGDPNVLKRKKERRKRKTKRRKKGFVAQTTNVSSLNIYLSKVDQEAESTVYTRVGRERAARGREATGRERRGGR